MASNTSHAVAPGEPARADIALLESLRTRLMSLVWILEQMKKELVANQTAPPDWPTIQKSITTVSSTINSIQQFINQDPETLSTFAALHAFPISPFPASDPQLGALIDTIFAKEPGAKEKDWMLEKLSKAAEFAHVPGDWGIEAKRAVDVTEEGGGRGDSETVSTIRMLRRKKAMLDEDQLAELWEGAYEIIEPILVEANEARVADEDEDEQGGDDDEEDEEMEDVLGDGAAAAAAASVGEQQQQKEGKAKAEAEAKAAAEQPMMSLDTINRFVSTGSAIR